MASDPLDPNHVPPGKWPSEIDFKHAEAICLQALEEQAALAEAGQAPSDEETSIHFHLGRIYFYLNSFINSRRYLTNAMHNRYSQATYYLALLEIYYFDFEDAAHLGEIGLILENENAEIAVLRSKMTRAESEAEAALIAEQLLAIAQDGNGLANYTVADILSFTPSSTDSDRRMIGFLQRASEQDFMPAYAPLAALYYLESPRLPLRDEAALLIERGLSHNDPLSLRLDSYFECKLDGNVTTWREAGVASLPFHDTFGRLPGFLEGTAPDFCGQH